MEVISRKMNPGLIKAYTKLLYAFQNKTGDFDCNLRFYTNGPREKSCKLLIIGGGAGGCSVAAKFSKKLGKNDIIVVEPSDVHYYQPMFTLVGGGMKTLQNATRPMKDVLPKNVEWVKDTVQQLEPQGNFVTTQEGTRINYEYMVIAAGLKLDYGKIPGLVEALSVAGSGVCSIYSPDYVQKTWQEIQYFDEGSLIFTFPNTPVKCAGAPQKICYIAEQYLRNNNKRGNSRVIYNTSLGVIFGVKKYADSLWKICRSRGIEVNLRTNLKCIEPDRKIAWFENLDNPDLPPIMMQYSVLHVTPPMGPPPFLRCTPMMCDTAGYLDVDKNTLRHRFFPNIFGIGDCTSCPTSKTAAAVAAQSGVLYDNLFLAMCEQAPTSFYNGYTSCPLVTGNKVILAEFDYDLKPVETFPFDQSKESRLMFFMKKDLMPLLYWNAMLKGYWSGPELMRRIFHLDFKQKKNIDLSTPR